MIAAGWYLIYLKKSKYLQYLFSNVEFFESKLVCCAFRSLWSLLLLRRNSPLHFFLSLSEPRGKRPDTLLIPITIFLLIFFMPPRSISFDVTSAQRETGDHVREVGNIDKNEWQFLFVVFLVIVQDYDSNWSRILTKFLSVVVLLLWKSVTYGQSFHCIPEIVFSQEARSFTTEKITSRLAHDWVIK